MPHHSVVYLLYLETWEQINLPTLSKEQGSEGLPRCLGESKDLLGTWKAAHASLEKLHFWTEMHRAVCRQFTHRALSFVVAHYKYIISSVFSYHTHTHQFLADKATGAGYEAWKTMLAVAAHIKLWWSLKNLNSWTWIQIHLCWSREFAWTLHLM